ncbi:MAG TPA: ABC transporter ATP-binding protein [Chloroflexota bacterium]|nr:ABC transporter ATP-binding protein [Chloroflexota bacterium]
MSESSIELRNVQKRFGAVKAVDGVSLAVQRGEFLTLLGPSGCGKTTTLRLVAGFEQPSAGEILIAGQPVAGLPPNRRNVNTVFQNYALFPHMNVAENVGFGLRMKRLRRPDVKRRVADALAMVRLEGLGGRRPSQLSGGQQQRVALARALVNRPAVLLLDEPLGALDLKPRRAMQTELRTLNRTVGITFVYVTHDQEEALTMSDRIAVMSGGQILQLGSAQEIYETPASRFVADFIGEANFLEGKVLGWTGGVAAIGTPAGTIAVRCRTSLSAGLPACVFVRPERVGLAPPGAKGTLHDNLVRGRLVEAVYAGAAMIYTVALADHSTIVARTPIQAAPPEPGSEVTLRWSTSECSVLI